MPVHFQHELSALKEKLLVMARHAESAVSRAMRAFTERDDALAQKVKADDSILDAFEKEIDELAIKLLTHAPLASDLRLITVAMKICHNLERVGDEATTIARRVGDLNQFPRLATGTDPAVMAAQGLAMLQAALEAFVKGDTTKARAVIPRDKQLDAANRQLHLELKAHMNSDASRIPCCLHWMTISKSLERIGDHAKNIAEEVVYLLEGRDIRHAAESRTIRLD